MKPKKPNFDPSSLPSGKGISAKPAKMRDASPNFVEQGRNYKIQERPVYKVTDLGPNLGTNESNKNVPRVEYSKFEKGDRERANVQQMSKEGKFEYLRPVGCGKPGCDLPIPTPMPGGKKATSIPVKNEQLNTIMDKNNKNLRIGNAKKVEKYIK
jgi:hypothetical protein